MNTTLALGPGQHGWGGPGVLTRVEFLPPTYPGTFGVEVHRLECFAPRRGLVYQIDPYHGGMPRIPHGGIPPLELREAHDCPCYVVQWDETGAGHVIEDTRHAVSTERGFVLVCAIPEWTPAVPQCFQYVGPLLQVQLTHKRLQVRRLPQPIVIHRSRELPSVLPDPEPLERLLVTAGPAGVNRPYTE